MGKELPSDWNTRRKKVLKRDDYECQNCGRTGGSRGHAKLNVHHNVPRHSGGTHKLSNLKTFCNQCHDAIHYEEHKAPTAKVNQVQQKSEKEVVHEVISSPFTFCSECREKDNISLQEASEFLEYDKRPREFIMRGQRLGSVMCPHSIRCGECGTLYKKVKPNEDVLLEPVEFDNDVSSNWYYGIIGSLCSYLVIIGFLTSSLTQPVSMYYDIKYMRGISQKNPDMKYWVLSSFIPVLNIFVALLYLKTVRNIEIESETSPVLETCPACGMEYTELSRLFPPDTIDCTMCGSRFKSGKFGLSNQMTLVEGNPDKIGETHTVDEWKGIAQSKSETDSKTNLLATSEENTEGEQNDRQ